ncbi:MAG: hypothetical protein M1827_001886 [Pycnora praestabilis]|nr:MAG: hypothetical protein M1827_001886 [Pycnora praestabilis]
MQPVAFKSIVAVTVVHFLQVFLILPSALSTSLLKRNDLTCVPAFGRPYPSDCYSAISKLPTNSYVLTFTHIEYACSGAELPRYYQTGNCIVAIYVNLYKGTSDMTSWGLVSLAATEIVASCTEPAGGSGGMQTIGWDSRLHIYVYEGDPANPQPRAPPIPTGPTWRTSADGELTAAGACAWASGAVSQPRCRSTRTKQHRGGPRNEDECLWVGLGPEDDDDDDDDGGEIGAGIEYCVDDGDCGRWEEEEEGQDGGGGGVVCRCQPIVPKVEEVLLFGSARVRGFGGCLASSVGL